MSAANSRRSPWVWHKPQRSLLANDTLIRPRRLKTTGRSTDLTGSSAEATVEQWLECGGATRAWDDPCPNGEPARFVKLTVMRGFKLLFGTVGYPNVQPDGTVRLTAHATLRVS